MKISGIVTEFNPFHNGHKFLIEKAKEKSDAVICVMSGSFVQRGDVAIFDKWTRTKAALLNGADLIIELPAVFSVSTAERFAYGAIELLSAIGCVNEICFGSEHGDINTLISAAELMFNEPAEVSALIKKYLDDGNSFPVSRQKAYSGYIPDTLLKNPNNILAIEYILSAFRLGFNVKFKTIQRIGNGYHSTDINSALSSATALRKCINEKIDYAGLVPGNLTDLYDGAETYSLSSLNNTIIYLLRTVTPSYLANVNDVSEGLENRLQYFAAKYDSVDKIIEKTVTKRYTRTKIMRILISLLLQIDKDIIRSKNSYVRVLGFNDTGREIIKNIKKTSQIPVITKAADFKEENVLFQTDIRSTDIAALCTVNPDKKICGKDFLIPPVYVKNIYFP